MDKKLFLVKTTQIVHRTYVVRAEEMSHALDEVSMLDSGSEKDYFEPVEIKHAGEQICDYRPITDEDFKNLLKQVEEEKSGDFWLGDKLIRDIDYGQS